ncbi:MAG: hypothetical protein ACLRLR_09265 [Faecalibacterium prausnitzii]
MKMAKKFLAVALAGVLALSVLTGCANGVKSKDVADSLTKMGIKVEQSKDVDKTAKSTLTAIEAIINSETNTGAAAANKITLENAVVKADGKVIKENNFVGSVDNVKKALGVFTGAGATVADKANEKNQVRVALVEIKNAKKDASLQAAFVKDVLFQVQAAQLGSNNDKVVAETGKLGTATTKDGKYMLVVIVNDVVAKNA